MIVTIKDTTKKAGVRARKAEKFMQMMCNRLLVGMYRHERGKDQLGDRIQDYHKRLKGVIREYEVNGNLEKLLDAANYCMLEFYNSNHPNQHFKEEDSNGRTRLGGE